MEIVYRGCFAVPIQYTCGIYVLCYICCSFQCPVSVLIICAIPKKVCAQKGLVPL